MQSLCVAQVNDLKDGQMFNSFLLSFKSMTLTQLFISFLCLICWKTKKKKKEGGEVW